MTPLIQLWLASSVGAALFLSAGFLLAQAMHRVEQGLAEAHLTGLRAELDHAQSAYAAQSREVDHLEHRAQRAEQSASGLSDALAQARAECVRLDKEVAGRTHAHWEARAQELDAAAKRAQAAEAQHRALSLELERMRKEQRGSAGRVQRLSTRAARLDAQEQDNAQLKKQCESMSDELHRLRQSGLSDVFGHSLAPESEQLMVPPAPRIASGYAAEPASPTEQGLEAILQRQLSMLMVREPDVTAVLSDAHGLALVGLGPARDQEHVSVLTSIARDLAARTRELVGFERIEALEIMEAGGRALRVRFFDWADQPLALGYVGARRLLQSEAEERMVSSFPPLRIVHSA